MLNSKDLLRAFAFIAAGRNNNSLSQACVSSAGFYRVVRIKKTKSFTKIAFLAVFPAFTFKDKSLPFQSGWVSWLFPVTERPRQLNKFEHHVSLPVCFCSRPWAATFSP